ncbi:hypothetical protein HanRHA438_Chr12g0545461 [Helianthus annuus]|nr:hypothetical protein HanOQP8_Chr12g0440971 [Helianthus annuus]KAJ0865877.1 hypothetical protein HanRHA438_Chr12g0545461 [Helianthus annuus]
MCSRLSPTSVPAMHDWIRRDFFGWSVCFGSGCRICGDLRRAVRGGTNVVWFAGGGGDRNVSVEIESGSGGNMGEFEKRKAASRIRHAFDKDMNDFN